MNDKKELLKKLVAFNPNDDLPLHAQVRRVLGKLASEHFNPGDRFFSEPILIDCLGVSQGTVRRALGDLVAGNILVRRPAKGTYVNDQTTTKPRMLGVIVPFYPSTLFESLLERLSKWCATHNRKLDLIYLHRQDGKGLQPLKEIHWNAQDGDVIMLNLPPLPTWQIFERLDSQGYRTVNIGSALEVYPGNYVGTDTTSAVRMGIEHLAHLGHKRIAYLASEPMEFISVRQGCEAFSKLAPEAGLEYCPVINCETRNWESSFDNAYRKAHVIDWKSERVTAVYAGSDAGAWALLRYFSEQHVQIPKEISILGFGNDRSNDVVSPPLTSIDFQPQETLDAALAIFSSPETGPQTILIQPRLQLRASTSHPSASAFGAELVHA